MRQILLAVTLALAVAGCGNDSNPAQPTTGTGTAVSMRGSGASGVFNPVTLTTTVGSTVVWTNTDNKAHTTTSNTGLWSSGDVPANGTFSFQFTTAGTFAYRCTIHAGMTGTVIVQ
jgi:plastocyanin